MSNYYETHLRWFHIAHISKRYGTYVNVLHEHKKMQQGKIHLKVLIDMPQNHAYISLKKRIIVNRH